MSRPGELTAAELTDVEGGQLLDVVAAWWVLAGDELEQEFGFRPEVVSTGLYRTRAVQVAINEKYGQNVSPDDTDHCKGRAADIRNWQAYHDVDRTKFTTILANHGFYNQQIDGRPFPSEPWHYRNLRENFPKTNDEEQRRRSWQL
ncbi:hypothetical protein [Microcella sp.]|uniref:hypothetical protein n=1 Tax=Microcella sp. TaxID=1913979 RepID=UPI00391B6B54